MKYIKKPKIYEAFQWMNDEFALRKFIPEDSVYNFTDGALYLDTMRGMQKVEVGDYIMRSNYGDYTKVNKEAFENTYQKAPDHS